MVQTNTITVFFYIIIFALIFLIIYFNVIAGINYSKSMIIDVKNNSQCSFQDLPLLDKNQVCNNGEYYYQSPTGNYYILGKNPIFYLSVCKILCGGGTELNGQCGEINPAGFDKCLDDLQPQSGCKNSAVPLVQDENKNLYYAQEVNISIPCKI
jgi:hypothetical protein